MSDVPLELGTSVESLEARLGGIVDALAQRAVQAATLCVSRGPLSPLTAIQSVQMRVQFSQIVRDAVGAGRAHERALRALAVIPSLPSVVVHPNATAYTDPRFDEEPTLPQHPGARGWERPDAFEKLPEGDD